MLIAVIVFAVGINTVTLMFISGHLANIHATLGWIASVNARREKE